MEPNTSKSFINLKDLLCKAPVLKYFDPKLPVFIQTDASKDGLGACLLQNNHPVAYASRSLTLNEQKFAQIEKELLAIVFALEKFHYYIYGKHVIIYSDHKPLESIVKKEITKITSRLQRMALKLIKYDFKVIYMPGKKMFLADTLSRSYLKDPVKDDPELEMVVHTFSKHLAITPQRKQDFQEATRNDESLQLVKKYIEVGWPQVKENVDELAQEFWKFRNDLELADDLIFVGDKLFVPKVLRQEILKQIHEGHQGIEKCKLRARSIVFWPRITRDIEQMVKNCLICEKYQHRNRKETLFTHPVPNRAWERVAADILSFQRTDYLVIMDYYSNWIELVKLQEKTASEIIIRCKEIFSRNGIPEIFISDNMPFNSHIFKQFAKEWDFRTITSSPCYPQSNGLAERGVQIAKNCLKKASEETKDVYSFLMEYRNTPLKNLNLSPAQIMLNRKLRTKLPMLARSLEPRIEKNVKRKKNQIKELMSSYYNRSAINMEPLKEGQSATIRKGKIWEPAQVIGKCETPRSYLVRTSDNEYRRNRRDLRVSHNEPPRYQPEMEGGFSNDQNVTPRTNLTEEFREETDTPLPTFNPSADTNPTSPKPLIKSDYTVKPTRVRKPPVRFADYVTNF